MKQKGFKWNKTELFGHNITRSHPLPPFNVGRVRVSFTEFQCIQQHVSQHWSGGRGLFHLLLAGIVGAKPLRAKPFEALHWSQIDTNRHRKDSVCVARQTFQRCNHISHEMPLFWQHIAIFVNNCQPMTKLGGGGGHFILCPPTSNIEGDMSPASPRDRRRRWQIAHNGSKSISGNGLSTTWFREIFDTRYEKSVLQIWKSCMTYSIGTLQALYGSHVRTCTIHCSTVYAVLSGSVQRYWTYLTWTVIV